MSGKWQKPAAILSVVDAIIGIGTFFYTYFLANFPIDGSILSAVLLAALLIAIALLDWKTNLHSQILLPIRLWVLFKLASLVVDVWNANLGILANGDATIQHEIEGHANFGQNSWIVLGIEADEQQRDDFKIQATDLLTNEVLNCDFMLNEPRYKRVRIRFGEVLERGENFKIRVEYGLEKTYYFDREDSHNHRAYHWERNINLQVRFQGNVRVDWADGLVRTETGDEWRKYIPKAKKVNDKLITWSLKNAGPGNSHILKWRAVHL